MTNQWEKAGVFEIAPGIHRIPLPVDHRYIRATNVFAVLGDDGITLIDGGDANPRAERALVEGLRQLNASVKDVIRVLVTHAHSDHYPLAIWIRQIGQAEVCVGAGDRESIKWLSSPEMGSNGQGELLLRAGASAQSSFISNHRPADPRRWDPPDRYLSGGTVDVGWGSIEVVETPGHTAGHLCFALPEMRLVFTGDHLLPSISPAVGIDAVPTTRALRAYLSSLETLGSMVGFTYAPAHGPVSAPVEARVSQLHAHHRERLDELLGLLPSDGWADPYSVARSVSWTRAGRHFDELDDFNQVVAVRETLSHLEYLVLQGRARWQGAGPGASLLIRKA